MAKRKSAVEIKEIIIRLRKKQGIREIHRESGIHRATIRTIKKTANELGWLNSKAEIPSEEQIESVFNKSDVHKKKHALDLFQNDFERWIGRFILHRNAQICAGKICLFREYRQEVCTKEIS